MRLPCCIALLMLGFAAHAEVTIERIGDTAVRVAPAPTSGEHLRVATLWPPIHAIANELCKGSAIQCALIPTPLGEMETAALSDAIKQSLPPLDAILTIRGAWSADPSYAAARQASIRTIEMDATRPLDGNGAGISLIPQGVEPIQPGQPPLFWLSLENLARMTEILARDLALLHPEDATVINENLSRMKNGLSGLARFAASQTALLEDTDVADPGSHFTYLIQSIGLSHAIAGDETAPILMPTPVNDPAVLALHGLLALGDSAAPWSVLLAQYQENIANLVAALQKE